MVEELARENKIGSGNESKLELDVHENELCGGLGVKKHRKWKQQIKYIYSQDCALYLLKQQTHRFDPQNNLSAG